MTNALTYEIDHALQTISFFDTQGKEVATYTQEFLLNDYGLWPLGIPDYARHLEKCGYIPRGVPEETKEKTPFRIGGVYRDRRGDVIRLDRAYPDGDLQGELLTGIYAGSRSAGYKPDTGAYVFGDGNSDADLLPGELIQRDGQWVAVEEGAEDLDLELRELERGLRADQKEGVREINDLCAEPKHPRLTWADTKPADRFPGFVVVSSTTEQENTSGKFSSPDLTGEWKPFEFGSAHLKG